ncbi:MAG: tetratricopeptide repeat protein [Trueperaceae bacterium]|nr:tetratricopeptide repeat protein [Trueperaceae bacterium]
MIRTWFTSTIPLKHALAALLVAVVGFASAQGTDQETLDASTLIENGAFYLDRGDCALAQFFYQEALRGEPNNAVALVGKGRSLACQGAYPAAIETFQAAQAADSNLVDANIYLAITYQNQYQADPNTYSGRLADALDTIQRAERTKPDDWRVQNTKGVIQYLLGDLAGSRTTLERAATLVSADTSTTARSANEKSTVQVNLGRVYRDLDELELALQAFRRAVVLDPSSWTAHNNLGNIAYRLGDCGTAEYELSQAASLNPDSVSAVSQLGIALFECDDVAGSVPWLEKAVTLDGAVFLPPVYTYLARAYLTVGRVDEAVKYAQQGAVLPPPSADAFFWLGKTYQRRNNATDAESAKRAFERALELDPDYADAREALGR